MAGNIVRLKATDGSSVEYINESPKQGGMKDVYFSPDRSYVVAFFREPLDPAGRERIQKLVTSYADGIFNQVGGEYWRKLYCWPERIVQHEGLTGLVMPAYEGHFFFGPNSSKPGVEKDGKWFASATHYNHNTPPEERGNLASFLSICIKISRAVRRLHSAGLAHSDLSYKNCLIDPLGMNVCILDIDGLVVPGIFPPDVIGTPDFIAPEVVATRSLSVGDPHKKLPRRETDQHALAVLIYMYLLHRHPLRGRKVHDLDDQKQEELEMGMKALFVEHPTDASNRVRLDDVSPKGLPWVDPEKIPYTICGPYLKPLFDQSFIEGLHNPARRPSADDWEAALVKTTDLLQPCQNPKCAKKWFVFISSMKRECPYCGTAHTSAVPVLNLCSSRDGNNFRSDNHQLVVHHNKYLYPWHMDRTIHPNERLTPELSKPVGYFVLHHGKWMLINQSLQGLENQTVKKPINVGEAVELTDGMALRFNQAPTGRVAYCQFL